MYPYSQSVDLPTLTGVRGGAGGRPERRRDGQLRPELGEGDGRCLRRHDQALRLGHEDPIIKAWKKAFPSLFADAAEMPADLRSHVRYPEDLFRVQTNVYQRYHMIDTHRLLPAGGRVGDPGQPECASTGTATGCGELEPYYVLMQLPGSDKDEYVLILPMNPRNKPNMISLLVAKSDPEEFGKLVDMQVPDRQPDRRCGPDPLTDQRQRGDLPDQHAAGRRGAPTSSWGTCW